MISNSYLITTKRSSHCFVQPHVEIVIAKVTDGIERNHLFGTRLQSEKHIVFLTNWDENGSQTVQNVMEQIEHFDGVQQHLIDDVTQTARCLAA